ncbi:MAG: prepilin-type N-terminal cleavage/methylation domain-containing protein [Acidobacteriia bacterium]|nr:prepilin-type N-terminal cleavage/methylation domain-containing protein [Terriglobia bacterium]
MTGAGRAHSWGAGGFTLLELSIVLVIIALVAGMTIQSGISVVETARLVSTQKKMKTIQDALMQYRIANDRLPCPGNLTLAPGIANYGIEAANSGTCTGGTPAANFSGAGLTNTFSTAAEGALPALTLGLPPDFMVDGWGNQFRYAVDISMTASGAFAAVNIGCANGAVTVTDANGNARSTSSIYALVSHGANGHGAYTRNGAIMNAGSVNINELTNCHCNSSGTPTSYAPTYVQMQQTLDFANAQDSYDDLVAYKERWQMQTTWDRTGKCIYLYTVDYSNDRVQKFAPGSQYVLQFGTSGSGNSQFSGPQFAAGDSWGNVYVADTGNNRIQKFSSLGTYLLQFGTAGSGNGQLNYPTGIAVDQSGNVWVDDADNFRVQEFNATGNYLTQFPLHNAVGGTTGIAIDGSGNFWVLDWAHSTVNEYSSAGAYLTGFGSSGSGIGQFSNYLFGIAIDPSGNVWISDTHNNRVQEFDSSGHFLQAVGTSGSGNGQFNSPQGIAVDTSGNVWVADAGNYRIQKFTNAGAFVSAFGSWGTGNSNFSDVAGLAFGSQ